MTRVTVLRMAGRGVVLALCATLLAACAETQFLAQTAKTISKTGGETGEEGVYKVGKPYQISGTWYYPAVDYEYSETGIASWYGSQFHGKQTANGERFDMNKLSAAHRTLPLPCFVRVTNLENGRSLVLRVNDRGPFAKGRILDASRRAAQLLGYEKQGTARVQVTILAAESRALAARMQGTQVAAADSPLTVDSIPTVNVSSETLPPPPGGEQAAQREVAPLPGPSASSVTPVEVASQDLTETPVAGVVSKVPVTPTQIFIQAGAFGVYENANRVKARLSGVGNVEISPVLVDGRDLYRVRVGPISNVEEADRVLERVGGAGYNEARIIVVD